MWFDTVRVPSLSEDTDDPGEEESPTDLEEPNGEAGYGQCEMTPEQLERLEQQEVDELLAEAERIGLTDFGKAPAASQDDVKATPVAGKNPRNSEVARYDINDGGDPLSADFRCPGCLFTAQLLSD